MRILITNPDGIGDILLRQPMFSALMDEGHELFLAVRALTAPVASLAAPGATVGHCHVNPYVAPPDDEDDDALDPLISRVRDFRPELIVVAPYQRTWLDESIVERFSDLPTLGLSGCLYPGPISQGLDATSNLEFSQTVAVSADDPEVRKNELLCSAVLGRDVSLPNPSIHPAPNLLRETRERLARLALEPGGYWIASVGHSGWTAIRNWDVRDWASALSRFVERCELPLLFVGAPDESDVTEQVREQMGTASERTVNLCPGSEPLESLVGLTAESAGYIGRDTGPMHLAAALSKPVVAVFGGGTWPRFIPAAARGAAVAVGVPCSGCMWICHLPEPHCVKRVPVEAVVEEMEKTLSGAPGFRVREIEADRTLRDRMAAEAADSYRASTRKANRSIRELQSRVHDLERSLAAERDEKWEQIRLLEQQIRLLGERIQTLLAEAGEQRSSYARLEGEHSQALLKLDAIRRSVFTRILTALRIWRVFR